MKRSGKKAISFAAALTVVCSLLLTALHISASAVKMYEEVTSEVIQSYRLTGTSDWYGLTASSRFSGADGILLQTEGTPYILKYKCRDGYRGWLDPVYSTDRGEYDYAGWPGYSVTNITIDVYIGGDAVYDRYVVMYRAMAAGVWLDWVSNGTADVMQTIANEYDIDGGLDMYSADAGWAVLGCIQALEIRVFERSETSPTPSANATLLDVPYISQLPDYPNGCESVSAVMALNYFGIDMDVNRFVSSYLEMDDAPSVGDIGPDPSLVFCGDPRLSSGWGCYSPVIASALGRIVDDRDYEIISTDGRSLGELSHTCIDNGIPVMIWATVGMTDSSDDSCFARWTTPSGKEISYNRKLHCLLLVGYDEDCYFFNDPLRRGSGGADYIGYPKDAVRRAYDILGRQSVVISPKKPLTHRDIIHSFKINKASVVGIAPSAARK